jgi:lysyl-tRNA synthetase class 2
MKIVEKLYKTIIKTAFGTLTINSNGMKVNWGKKWERVDYTKAFHKATGVDLSKTTVGELQQKASALGLRYEKGDGMGKLIDLIYKKTVRPHIIGPAFLINHPVVISPLAKKNPKTPHTTERLQVLAYGSELGNGWVELNDPVDQRIRFEEQVKLRAAGDDEAQMMDEDYVEAMEYGMPPAIGFGFSERLFAVLAGKPVRETVFFPSMRNRNNSND